MNLHFGFGSRVFYVGLWRVGTFAGHLSWLDHGCFTTSDCRWGVWMSK